jgi:hypothetical protein
MLCGKGHGCLAAGRIVAREEMNLMMGSRRDFIFSTNMFRMEVRSLAVGGGGMWVGGLREGRLLAAALA